jgi:predicted pyridoxine 5'-phosphate oxidase superfamily flavin-nucleotide-binding protein
VLSPETTAFLEGGPALIVGTVSADGAPTATNAWGVTVLSAATGECRVLLDRDAERALANLEETRAIALTGADVATVFSVQLKGRCIRIEPATDADRARSDDYIEAFFDNVIRTDRRNPTSLNRLRPNGILASIVRFEEIFDQTPGPGAGAALHTGSG